MDTAVVGQMANCSPTETDSLGINYSIIDPGQRWRMLKSQKRFCLWCLYISSGITMQGFDIIAGGQLAALPEFKKQFGSRQPDGSYIIPARSLSAWNSIAPACEILCTFIYAPLLEKYGRRPGILVASAISAGGILLQQLATDWRVHLAGRGVNGIAIGMMFTTSPLWIGETCRPELRGFFLCFFNTSIVFGQLAMLVSFRTWSLNLLLINAHSAAVSRGSSYLTGRWQWWLPVVGMYIFPAILTSGWLFFPESPYWLVRHGKSTQARESLQRVYGIKNETFYTIEVRRMESETLQGLSISGNLSQNPRHSFLGRYLSREAECFNPLNRKRTLTAIFVASGQQMIGATFVIGYTTYFLDLIGVKDYFDASIVLYVVMLLASMGAFPLTESVGRRTMIVIPQFVLCGILLLIGVLGCLADQEKANWAIIVFVYIWAIMYQLSIGAAGFVLASEIATVRLRSTTQGLVTITNAVWGLVMQFSIPYMINPDAGNLGGKVGFIFLGTGLIAAIGGWFLYPETKGITFETMDRLYASGTAPRHFRVSGQGGCTVESKGPPV